MSHSGRRGADHHAAWLHRLRNEVNTAQMAAVAALVLLDSDQPQRARENIDRAVQACRRSARLLADDQTTGQPDA